MKFRNSSNLEFVDISSELWREYEFTDGRKVRIEKPLKLHVSDNGHRIFDKDGVSHYIPMTWISLRWKAAENEPHFVM